MTRPVVCTLDASDMADRERAWRKLLGSGLVQREQIPGGLKLTAEPGAVDALLTLVELERECCAWIDYETRNNWVRMTAAGAGEQVLAGMFRTER